MIDQNKLQIERALLLVMAGETVAQAAEAMGIRFASLLATVNRKRSRGEMPPGQRGRPKGKVRCKACGKLGHSNQPGGDTCSRSWMAAQDFLAGNHTTISDAAEKYGVSHQAVSQVIRGRQSMTSSSESSRLIRRRG